MKTRTLAAKVLAATTLALLACNLINKKTQLLNASDIKGKWMIDSVDRSIFNVGDPAKGTLFSKPAFFDSLPMAVEFSHDSIYYMYNSKSFKLGSDKYYFDSATQRLFVREGYLFNPFAISALNDSIIKIDFLDAGIHYLLKKQP